MLHQKLEEKMADSVDSDGASHDELPHLEQCCSQIQLFSSNSTISICGPFSGKKKNKN